MPPVLETPRLTLRLGADEDIPAILAFYKANRDHLAPYDPVHPPAMYTAAFWKAQLRRNLESLETGRAVRTFLFHGEERDRVIGVANLNEIIRGAFHSCFLGFSLDEKEQGKGLMAEALRALLGYAFGELNLHRISANYMPHNRRSGQLLRRLGFVVEGFARDYLLIAGNWEDHVLTVLHNPEWKREA